MRRPGSTTLRIRLATGSALAAAVVLSALALLINMQVRDASTMSATQLAADDLRPYAVDLRHQPTEAPDPAAAGLLIVIQAPDGTVRRNTMPAAVARAARTVTAAANVTVDDDEYRIVGRRVVTSHGTWRLWAARDLTASDSVLHGIQMSLLFGTPIAVVMTAMAAYLIATAALLPVERMRATAEHLRQTGSAESLPERGAGELAGLAATLNRLIDDLRASAEHERRVTADAAHELRTPLAILAAQVELAERHPTAADLPSIRVSVDRMARLIDDLLALSRAEAPEQGTPPATIIADLVTEAMAAVDRTRLLAPPTVTVDLELGPQLDELRWASIDVMSFGRILTNLLGNALAAGPASSVITRLDLHGQLLELCVQDDGPGLPTDFIPYAFDRFARPEGARSSTSPGAGLGLALVRLLAERSGGSAALRNGEQRGAVATVRIPTERGRGD